MWIDFENKPQGYKAKPLLVELLYARYPEVGGPHLRGVLWLRAADTDAVLAGNDDAVPTGINLTQRARIDREAHVGHRMEQDARG